MLPTPAAHYLTNAFDHAPAALSALLDHLREDSSVWDTRPAQDRFSLREIVAHLADWDDIWRERFGRTLDEDAPLLLRPDLDQRATERGYATADGVDCLARLRESRAALTDFLRALPEDAWTRTAALDRMGEIPLHVLVALAVSHDSYHVRQVAEWLAAARR
jgi:uncharacterized damage-inducible protein DinB